MGILSIETFTMATLLWHNARYKFMVLWGGGGEGGARGRKETAWKGKETVENSLHSWIV